MEIKDKLLADKLERAMQEAAAKLDFEEAAKLRDLMIPARNESSNNNFASRFCYTCLENALS